MKIFWIGVSPAAKTGYGAITREIVRRLKSKHEIYCVAHLGDTNVWGGHNEQPLGKGASVETLALVSPLSSSFAAGQMLESYDLKYSPDLHIGFWDAFALPFLRERDVSFLAYVPVDGPLTEKWIDYVKDSLKVVTYSKYGYEEFVKNHWPLSELERIDHGIDTEVFRPLAGSKQDHKKTVNLYRQGDLHGIASPPIPEDSFLFTYVAANYGDRKKIPLFIRTFAKFVKAHKEAHLYLHTNTSPVPNLSYDIHAWIGIAAEKEGVDLRQHVHVPLFDPSIEGLSDESMNLVYNATDVYVSNSSAEGFGMPLLEAMSAGVPLIAPDNSSQTEIVGDNGWLVDCLDPSICFDVPIYVPQLTEYPVPNQKTMLEKMEEAFTDDKKRRRYGIRARGNAVAYYDWDYAIMPKWFKLLDRVEQELEIWQSIPMRPMM